MTKLIKLNGIKWISQRVFARIRRCCVFALKTSLRISLYLISRIRKKKTLLVVYQPNFCPVSFDTAWFFLSAELERQRLGFQDITVAFYPQYFFKDGIEPTETTDKEGLKWKYSPAIIDEEGLRWRFDNIVLPLMRLFPTITSYKVYSSRRSLILHTLKEWYTFPYHLLIGKEVTFNDVQKKAQKEFVSNPCSMKTSAAAQRYVKDWIKTHAKDKKLIVITIRFSLFDTKRNSNLEEWKKFAASCDPDVYHVVFIMDTDTISHGYPNDLNVFEGPSWNLGIRAALYEAAYMNLMTPGGPFTLCFLNRKCRSLLFNILIKDEPTASPETIESLGFTLYETPAWATPFQKFVWEEDTFSVIKREFDLMCNQIEGVSISSSKVPLTSS